MQLHAGFSQDGIHWDRQRRPGFPRWKGVEGVYRFLKRAFRMVTEQPIADRVPTAAEAKTLNATVKKVGEDLETMNFNTAISAMMVFVNEFAGKSDLPRVAAEKFTLCLAPFAPHLCEELWQFLGHGPTLAYEPWPEYDAAALVENIKKVISAVQAAKPATVKGAFIKSVTIASTMGVGVPVIVNSDAE